MLTEQSECEQILIQLSIVFSALKEVTSAVLRRPYRDLHSRLRCGGLEHEALERLEGALAQVLKDS